MSGSLFQKRSLREKGNPCVSCPRLPSPPGFDLIHSAFHSSIKLFNRQPGGIGGWAGRVKTVMRRCDKDGPKGPMAFWANLKEAPLECYGMDSPKEICTRSTQWERGKRCRKRQQSQAGHCRQRGRLGILDDVALGAKPVAHLSIGLSSDHTKEGASGLESVPSLLLILTTAAVFQTVSCGLLKRKLGQEGVVTPVWGSLLDLRFKLLLQMNINQTVYK